MKTEDLQRWSENLTEIARRAFEEWKKANLDLIETGVPVAEQKIGQRGLFSNE
jgi:hypothetical protein